jgi:hypothetical protein
MLVGGNRELRKGEQGPSFSENYTDKYELG